MKIFKNRTVLGIFCVVIAVLIAFVGMPVVQQITSRNTTIVRAKQDIPKGTLLDETMLEKVEVGKYNLPGDIVNDLNLAKGKYAAHSLAKSDYVTKSKLSDTIPFNDSYLFNLPDGKLAVSVEIKSLSAGLSGKLRAGDIVSIYASVPDKNGETDLKAQAPSELQYVKILSVSNSRTADIDDETLTNAKENDEKNIATITLLANKVQAQLLAGLDNKAVVHVALVSRGSNEKEQQLLKLQEDFFLTYKPETETAPPAAPTPEVTVTTPSTSTTNNSDKAASSSSAK